MQTTQPWRKRTYSGEARGNCAEVATVDTVLIRDTANRDRLTLSASAWSKFYPALWR
jgi:hypothetical protein